MADVETRTHCPYCALQCGLRVTKGAGRALEVRADDAFPVNRGRLCVKGFTAGVPLQRPDRLLRPLVRTGRGTLEEVEWAEALERVAVRLAEVGSAYGRDSVGVYGSGSLTNEKAYLLGKFARVALGTRNIDYNGRFCMSSAATAVNRSLGLDRGLPFAVSEIAKAEVVLLAGGNVAETMPPITQYFEAQRAGGGALIVVDPRRTPTAAMATHHLAISPGTDAALAHGLLHVLIRERRIDGAYIDARTSGFEAAKATVAAYWPGRVERITGVPQGVVEEVAKRLGRARSVIVLTGRGPEQQSQGVNNAAAYLNLALALGAVGRPGSGYGCLTGQGNGQGGREHGQKADQLPGYRHILEPAARRRMAEVWGVEEEEIPGPGLSAQELLESIGRPGGVRAVLVMGSNPAVSAADGLVVAERLRALDLLVVVDYFLSETAQLADVVLPSAQWAEEEGTMTNLEGRVLRRRRVLDPPAGVLSDVEILCALAERLGYGERFRYPDAEAVFDELRRATAGAPADYSGISYARIDRENGVFWPAPADGEAPARLFADRFPTADGRARFHAAPHEAPAEPTDRDYPLVLTTGRLLGHYQTGTQTHRVPQLARMAPRPMAQIHPQTADRHGIRSGDEVRLTTRRGSARFVAELAEGIRHDTVFVPFHWGGEGSANRLTNPQLDPLSRMPEFKVCAVRIEKWTTNVEVA